MENPIKRCLRNELKTSHPDLGSASDSFRRVPGGGVTKRRLFSQANQKQINFQFYAITLSDLILRICV